MKKIEEYLPGLKRKVLLEKYTTYKIGGPARYFFEAKNTEDLIRAITAVKKLKLSFFILAGGSNILFSDKGFNGLVIKVSNSKISVDRNVIWAEAGVLFNDLVKVTAENNLTGIEWAAGIPGTLGGAIYGNAQAFNEKIGDAVEEVEVLNLKTLKIEKLSKKQCQFKTKNSVFKVKKSMVIISAILKFKKGKKSEIQEKIKENVHYRKDKHPLNHYSAGSVFVNPEVKIKDKKVLDKYPEIKEFNKKGFIHVGYLIDKCGLKGKKIGDAMISEKHGNFILNLGKAKQRDILELIKTIKTSVKKEFKIPIQEEIIIVSK